ncbi:uncharacterized protein LOC124795040 [Schistocerca piceifrons]|uniref:uncharacterized protein LOC124795040 n=1 Tax=Schistocerca piceifrons TaxID=274613 RepID=UPI001F5F7275|nr:uncharacterized protein LOC124795040 [Schistocerca piceifrons]
MLVGGGSVVGVAACEVFDRKRDLMAAATMESEKQCNIQSFAVLDLETTGLPEYECNRTRITELSIVAVTRKHIIEAGNSEEKLPRVLQKLNLCICPKKKISLKASEMSGLYNDTLEDCSPFDDDVFMLLDAFLRRLPQPVCLISHNGFRFDFPILQTELYRLGKVLADGIFYVDSLIAFRQLLGQKAITSGVSCIETRNEQTVSLPASDGYDNILCDVVEKVEAKCLESAGIVFNDDAKYDYKQRELEKTPTQGIAQANDPPKLKPHENKPSTSEKTSSKVRKRLFDETNTHETESKVLKRFRLGDVYEFLLGKKPENCHHAEGDTLSLLQCIVTKGSEFLEWTDNNAKLFSKIQKLSF